MQKSPPFLLSALLGTAMALMLPATSAVSARNGALPTIKESQANRMQTAFEPLTLQRVFANPPLLGTAPRLLTIAPDGRHIAWLEARADNQLRYDLWVEEIGSGKRRMAVDSLALSGGEVKLSEDELMRRERARLASVQGVVNYQWMADGSGFLVPLDGDIWMAKLGQKPRRMTNTEQTELDSRLSPKGGYLSFVRDQNVYVIDVARGTERALTNAGGGAISYGVPEFVAQEEMHRLSGKWWSPDDRYLVVAKVDETNVHTAVRAAIASDGTKVSQQRYPFAGTPNAVVTLEVHALDGGPAVQVDLGADPDIYIARVNWLNARQFVVQRQSRDQKRLDLLLVEADSGKSRLLFSETSDSWLELHNSFRPLSDGKRFVWASERSGYRHLYLWDGAQLQPITRGNWEVDELVAFDEQAGTLLFSGYRETPLEKALYKARILDGTVERLSPQGYSSEVVSDARGTSVLLTSSSPTEPAKVELASVEGNRLRVRRQVTDADFPYASRLAGHRTPHFGTLKAADGVTDLHYALTLPVNLGAGDKAPVFFEVYAGPGVQRVRHGFGSMLHQYLLQQGWAVFQVDGRGTPGRGVAFRDPIYKKLGFPEVDDQMAALQWLKQQPGIDPDRVAVYGWSYGGYMVQRLLTKHPGAFRAGVSGAPVTDWLLYDTHYTERFLGNPAQDKGPYTASDVTLDADKLADPLLIIHGLADDNVVFDHSARMMGALQKAGKPFETMVYPGQTHAIRQPELQTHMWTGILEFLDRKVKHAR